MRIAERIIRADPKSVTIVVPPAAWSVAVVAGIGHIVYPLLPVIYEIAHQSGMRPEQPKAIATLCQPHLHALVTDGTFRPIGRFVAFPKIDPYALEHLFRHRVLRCSCESGELTKP